MPTHATKCRRSADRILELALISITCLQLLSQPWVAEANRERLDFPLESDHLLIPLQAFLKVLEFLTLLLLNLNGDLARPVKESGDFLEVLHTTATGCHRWRPDAHAARRERRRIPMDCIA